MKLIFAACFAVACFAAAAVDPAQSIESKLERIRRGPEPGTRTVFREAEVTAYAAREAAAIAPGALGDPHVAFLPERIEAAARIDFSRLQAASGHEPGWLLRKLLAGERPVRVRAHIASTRGHARVDLERVEISGVAVEGGALRFLIDNFVTPRFPDAVVGQWFALAKGLDRVELLSGRAVVVAAGARR